MPERFGPWSTVASRYRLWRKEGRWTRMLSVLQAPEELFLSSA
jgi:transposase